MLTWDDDVKPTSTAPMNSGSSWNRETSHSPLSQPALQPVASQVPQPIRTLNDGAMVPAQPRAAAQPAASQASHRRVVAADKRIINGQTDVNQLVPFKYKWACYKYLAENVSPR